jgi:hypothetical protein
VEVGTCKEFPAVLIQHSDFLLNSNMNEKELADTIPNHFLLTDAV